MLPELLSDWCESVVGGMTLLAECSHPHGESRVWHIRADSTGKTYYLKVHRRDGKREREIWAYTYATPVFGNMMPRLAGVRDEAPSALLFSALPGKPMEHLSLTPMQERQAWQEAGAVLSRLHSIAGPWFGRPDRNGDPMEGTQADAESFWRNRLEDWIRRAEQGSHLTKDEIAFARDRAQEVTVFQNEPAVATHHDDTRRNWIVSAETGKWLGVIDFEHVCFDVRVADFKLHEDRFFAKRRDLEEAFFKGYGTPLSERQQAQLRILYLHQGVSGVVWSREHNDPGFESENHAILQRLRSESR